MKHPLSNDNVLAYWEGRPLIGREAFARMGLFLRRLQAFSDAFSQLYVSDPNTLRNAELLPDFSNLEAKLIELIHPERHFINADREDFGFSSESRSRFGFDGHFSGLPETSDHVTLIAVTCGCFENHSHECTNLVDINIPEKLAMPAFLRGLLEQTVSFWRPADAIVTRGNVLLLLDQPVGDASCGWLTYLADPDVAGYVPPGFTHAPLEDGVVIQGGGRPGLEDDAEYVAGLLRLRDALRPHGFLSKRRALSLAIGIS